MLPAHAGFARHVSVSAQQLPTTHWLQGVPPGSSEQVPASSGGSPQCPPLQTSPTQHWAVVWQFDPGGRHAPDPQTPFSQAMLQHSSAVPQAKPSSLHGFDPQTLLVQTPEQHSKPLKHPKPSGVHEEPHPEVFGSQKPLQHSMSDMQGRPSGEQPLKLHVAVVGLQKPAQQSKSESQRKPSGRQPEVQVRVFWLQRPLQHWKSMLQKAPSGSQLMKPHWPFWQEPTQHSAEEAQMAPSGLHGWTSQ